MSKNVKFFDVVSEFLGVQQLAVGCCRGGKSIGDLQCG